jgi:hypothetical protein
MENSSTRFITITKWSNWKHLRDNTNPTQTAKSQLISRANYKKRTTDEDIDINKPVNRDQVTKAS